MAEERLDHDAVVSDIENAPEELRYDRGEREQEERVAIPPALAAQGNVHGWK